MNNTFINNFLLFVLSKWFSLKSYKNNDFLNYWIIISLMMIANLINLIFLLNKRYSNSPVIIQILIIKIIILKVLEASIDALKIQYWSIGFTWNIILCWHSQLVFNANIQLIYCAFEIWTMIACSFVFYFWYFHFLLDHNMFIDANVFQHHFNLQFDHG